MNRKIILLLSIITFNVAANIDDSALEEVILLSNQSEISFEEGREALSTSPGIFSDKRRI